MNAHSGVMDKSKASDEPITNEVRAVMQPMLLLRRCIRWCPGYRMETMLQCTSKALHVHVHGGPCKLLTCMQQHLFG